jgi:phenylacetate-CoA ligase
MDDVSAILRGREGDAAAACSQLRRIVEVTDGAEVPILEDALVNALMTVPFYAPLRERIVNGEDLNLTDFPLLSRDDLRGNLGQLLSRDAWTKELLFEPKLTSISSSGSTGQAVTVLKDARDWLWDQVGRERLYRELDLPKRLTTLTIARPPNLYDDLVIGTIFPRPGVSVGLNPWVSSNSGVRAAYQAVLEGVHPELIFASPSSLFDLISATAELGQRPLAPIAVITSWEDLSRQARDVLAAEFGCPVVNLYGSAETSIIGWSCGKGRVHVNSGLVDVETLQNDEAYDIVCTSKIAYAQPVIRYSIGDVTDAPLGPCPCGQESLAFTGLLGRTSHFAVGKSGKKYRSFMFLETAEQLGLSDYQFVQDEPGQLRLVLRSSRAAERTMAQQAQELLAKLAHGDDFAVTCDLSGDFVIAASGKRQCLARTC